MSHAFQSLIALIQHEAEAITNHVDGLRVRVRVARRARSLGELLRNQWDLLPDTHARLRRDHFQRSLLLRSFGQRLTRSRG